MYFGTKNYLKSTHNHTDKQALSVWSITWNAQCYWCDRGNFNM